MSVLLAVLAACCNAVSNLLERSAAREAAPELSMRLSLLRDLARRPRWLAGLSLLLVTFVLQATALGLGSVSLVQPLIVLELPLTVAGSAAFLGARLRGRDLLAVVAMVVGVVALLVDLHPTPARRPPGSAALLLATAAGAAGTALLVAAALRGTGNRRAALLGAAGGVSVGLTAVYMKRATAALSADGPLGALSAWETYAMVLAGLLGLYLAQNAYHAGSLVASQPGLTLADPATGLLLGALVLGEGLATGPLRLAVAAAAAAVTAAAVLGLARAPALRSVAG